MINRARSWLSELLHGRSAKSELATRKIIEAAFDAEYYRLTYPDVLTSNVDPLTHFIRFGWRENRNPSPDFDTHHYRSTNPDISDINPLEHYLRLGKNEGRKARQSNSFLYTFELENSEGVTPSRRPDNSEDFAIAVPFEFVPPSSGVERVAVIIHAYYPELVPELVQFCCNIPCRADLFVSTDTEFKAEQIRKHCRDYTKGSVQVRVFPNRGRDIAPMLVGFREVFKQYEIFVHLHTKRSPHGGGPLEGWRDYLLNSLLGSEDAVKSTFFLLQRKKVGVVFPQHLFVLRGILNWGYDFALASDLLRRAGFKLSKDALLEFPSGSMFWGKTDAFRKLLELDLSFDDFPEERGQVDGTLAHAIERVILFMAELAGYRWLKVISRDNDYPIEKCVLKVWELKTIDYAFTKTYRPLLVPVQSGIRAMERSIPETLSLLYYPSENERFRINVLLPSINPKQIFGGLGTAITIFEDLISLLGETVDFRIVVTDAAFEASALLRFPSFRVEELTPYDSGHGRIIISAVRRSHDALNLREKDIFIATAWWTAQIAAEARAAQRSFFGSRQDLVYLIQDYEPNFYGWGSKWVLAENTYHAAEDVIAIINAEELYAHFRNKGYAFKKVFCLPYKMNRSVSALLNEETRERFILIYGRPSVSRNAFEVLMDGLFKWQQRSPTVAKNWRILSAGEEYPADWASPVQNFSVVGKLTIDEYAFYLSRAAIGISLMISPHPSYPPLEMAEAGLIAISNRFDGKDLSRHFDNVISVDTVSDENLADALEAAVGRAEQGLIGKKGSRAVPRSIAENVPVFSASNLIHALGLHSYAHVRDQDRRDIKDPVQPQLPTFQEGSSRETNIGD